MQKRNTGPEGAMEQFPALEHQWNEALIEVAARRNILIDENIAQSLETETLRELQSRGERQKFLVLTAPTGVGKTTLGRTLEENGIRRLPRVNTRAARPGEVDGKDYFFVSPEEFERRRIHGDLLCATATEENAAAIPRRELLDAIAHDEPFYIDSGAGTARTIKDEPFLKNIPFALVFILPPSFQEMVGRARKRTVEESVQGKTEGSLSEEWLARRLERAVRHLQESGGRADAFVVNDDVERAVTQLTKIIRRG